MVNPLCKCYSCSTCMTSLLSLVLHLVYMPACWYTIRLSVWLDGCHGGNHPGPQSLTSSSHTLPEVNLGWNVGVGVPAALSCLHCPRGQGLDLAGPASFIVAPRYICYRLDNGPCSLVCMDACRASLMSSQLRTVTWHTLLISIYIPTKIKQYPTVVPILG